MKITKTKLKKIIQEEIKLMLEYERYVYRDDEGNLRISDDDGNDEDASHLESQYGHLKAGGDGETILGTGGGGGRDWGDSYGMDAPRRRRRW